MAAVHRCWGYQTEANLMVYKAMFIIRLCSKEAENVPKPNNVRSRSSLTILYKMCVHCEGNRIEGELRDIYISAFVSTKANKK